MLPEEKRRKTLGPDVKAETLLALQGDPARGKNQFTTICAACHRAGELGVDFAPDLTHVSTRLERNKIVERILQPSKNIDPQWELATLVTTDGETLSGFIGQRNDHDLRLRQAGGASKTVPTEKIASLTTAKVGVMPEGLMQGFTAEEAGDLLAFLWSLK
jgi:putative heme-binding domain-containing protein